MKDHNEEITVETKGDLTADEAVEQIKEKEDKGVVTIVLKKPVLYKGETIKELTFDFESLTGADSKNIDEELAAKGTIVISKAFSGPYTMRMAAKACDKPIGIDLFDILSLRDYNRIGNAARAFLLESE